MSKNDIKIINEQFNITRNIIDRSFLESISPNRSMLFRQVIDGRLHSYPLNCAGCFDWRPGFKHSHAMLVIFPIFFDYLDLHVDKILNLVNEKFGKKLEALKERIGKGEGCVEEQFVYELYRVSVGLRNKVLHHDFSRSDDFLHFKIEKKDIAIKISDIKSLNEVIFQYVSYGIKERSWYEVNALYSYFLNVAGTLGSEFEELVKSNLNFVKLHGSEQEKRMLHDSRVHDRKEPHHKVFDYCCSMLRSSNPTQEMLDKYPDPDHELVFSGFYYFHRIDNKYYLFPSDLIVSNKDVTFNDLSAWEYRPPAVSQE